MGRITLELEAALEDPRSRKVMIIGAICGTFYTGDDVLTQRRDKLVVECDNSKHGARTPPPWRGPT